VEFETSTDTLHVGQVIQSASPDTTDASRDPSFSIQIGAFKDPHNASLAQGLARDRYHLPVLNDFTRPPGLYQIRLGSFSSRELALEFLLRMQHDFPADYRDSWIVQLKR
jgi:hypothetical protein